MRIPAPTSDLLLPLLAIAVMLSWVYNQTLPLSGDEAYYWVWSHRLQPGYYDHPPGIALLIAATTRLLGDTVGAIRLAGSLAIALAIFLQTRLAAGLGGDRAAWLAFLLCLALPGFEMGMSLATPDDPLALFWTAGLCFALPALTGSGRWRDFIVMGLCCGAAMASKYTGVLLPFSLTLFVALRRPRLLVSAKLWGAGLAALLVFAPVIWWNAEHGFESFLFQYRHGSGEAQGFNPHDFLEFLGGQALVLSPVALGLLALELGRWRRWWKDDRLTLLALCCLAPLALFLEKALFAKIQLNWALPAYLAALPLVAARLAAGKRWLIVATVLPAILLSVAIKAPTSVGLTGKLNPQNRLYGPDSAAREVDRLRQPGDSLFADQLQRASLLTFLLSGHPRVSIPTETRISEYARWDKDLDFTALHGLYLSKDERGADLRKIFASVEEVEKMHSFHAGGREETYYLYRVGP